MRNANITVVHDILRSTVNTQGSLLGGTDAELNAFWSLHETVLTDSLGQPIIFLHGTPSQFDEFKQTSGRISTIFGTEEVTRHGFFFTQDRLFAERFAGPNGVIKEVYLKASKVLDLRNGFLNADMEQLARQGISERYMLNLYPSDAWEAFDGDNGEFLTQAMSACGYDCAIIVEPDDLGKLVTSHIVFSPEAIVAAHSTNSIAYTDGHSFDLC